MKNFATGTVTGTGAAINVPLGWTPDYIKVINITDGDRIDEWVAGMAAGTAVTTTAQVASTASNGLSLYTGNEAASKGFTIGSGISESGKTLGWVAQRNVG